MNFYHLKYLLVSVLLVVCLSRDVFCQSGFGFHPLKLYSNLSEEKWNGIALRTKLEINKINSSKKNQIADLFEKRLDLLKRDFNNKKFIEDSTLQNLVDSIWRRLLANNSISSKPGEILISKSSDVNALSYGEGTVIVNTGLIGRLRNESQIAFTLAHELAHYELQHTLNIITKHLESPETRKVMKAFARLKAGQINQKDILTTQAWAYSTSSYIREEELAADSLGFLYFKNSGYRQEQCIDFLRILDSTNVAKHNSGDRLFNPLSFATYPFKTTWVKDPAKRFARDTLKELFLDSIRTHPDIDIRIRNLSKWINKEKGVLNFLNRRCI